MTAGDDHARLFTGLRPLLFTIAYEILGSASDADDVLQDSYIQWSAVNLNDIVDVPAYVAKLVTRQSLNVLRSARRRRENYVGPWLPEPIRLDPSDSSDDVILHESVSMAMLVVLEALSPSERAVFVLHDVFDFTYSEIADMVGKSVPAVRQIAHRARNHVNTRGRHVRGGNGGNAGRVVEEFMAAAITGDVIALMRLLDPEVVWTSDGGGKVTAARKPVVGADKVARMTAGLVNVMSNNDIRGETAVYNGAPSIIIYVNGVFDSVYVFQVVDGAIITAIYAVRNPDKLVDAMRMKSIRRTMGS